MRELNNQNGKSKPDGGWKFGSEGDVLQVSGGTELSAVNSYGFRNDVQAELRLSHHNIELDLSEIQFMDSQGLGVLIGLQNKLVKRNGSLKIVNPAPQVQKIFELTRMGRVFEIVSEPGC